MNLKHKRDFSVFVNLDSSEEYKNENSEFGKMRCKSNDRSQIKNDKKIELPLISKSKVTSKDKSNQSNINITLPNPISENEELTINSKKSNRNSLIQSKMRRRIQIRNALEKFHNIGEIKEILQVQKFNSSKRFISKLQNLHPQYDQDIQNQNINRHSNIVKIRNSIDNSFLIHSNNKTPQLLLSPMNGVKILQSTINFGVSTQASSHLNNIMKKIKLIHEIQRKQMKSSENLSINSSLKQLNHLQIAAKELLREKNKKKLLIINRKKCLNQIKIKNNPHSVVSNIDDIKCISVKSNIKINFKISKKYFKS